MVQTIPARTITLHDLETKFGLTFIEDDQFFREWQDDLPDITNSDKQRLDRVKASYIHLFYILNPGNDLYTVLRVFKRFSHLATIPCQ